MKYILFLFSIMLIGCAHVRISGPEKDRQGLLDTDQGMSDAALKDGFNSTILAYADSGMVKLSDGNFPIINRKEFAKSFDEAKDFKNLSWKPLDCKVASSGELGYTWGNWTFNGKDTTMYGNYFTMWKKDKEGKWKILLDGGNNTPKPVN